MSFRECINGAEGRGMAGRLDIYYRGDLDTCNYTCSYCAFGRKSLAGSVDEDREAWRRFIRRVREREDLRVRIFLLPYGEAMIHDYYRDGLLELAGLPHVEGVGCQTNLSFSVTRFLESVEERGISPSKLRFWASFHPEMVAVEAFTAKIHRLLERGIEACAGVVGDPANLRTIERLRRKLDRRVYLFINAMQGLKRPLSVAEKKSLEEIDNLFPYDLHNFKASPETCRGGRGTVFMDGRGKVCACPRSGVEIGDFYREDQSLADKKGGTCKRKVCDCYIAYSNLADTPLTKWMGDGLFWRIPEKKPVRAIFFDIDGTLIRSDGTIPPGYVEVLLYYSAHIPLFLATSLPVAYAKRRLGSYFSLFRGGVFASGAHIRLDGRDAYHPLKSPSVIEEKLNGVSSGGKYQIRRYTSKGAVFKYSVTAPDAAKAEELECLLAADAYEVWREKRLVTVVSRDAHKGTGLLRVCEWAGISPRDVLAVGDTMQDYPMLSAAGHSCAVIEAEDALKRLSGVVLNPDSLPAFFSVDSPSD